MSTAIRTIVYGPDDWPTSPTLADLADLLTERADTLQTYSIRVTPLFGEIVDFVAAQGVAEGARGIADALRAIDRCPAGGTVKLGANNRDFTWPVALIDTVTATVEVIR